MAYKIIGICLCLLCGCQPLAKDMAGSDTMVSAYDLDFNDVLTLFVEPPTISQGETVIYSWPVKVCDNWGACDTGVLVLTNEYLEGDLDQNGQIDFRDIAVLAGNWGRK